MPACSAQARKTRIIDVIYNASNNELVRTKTLVKNCIVQIDAGPFRQWYEAHYATPLGRKKGTKLVRAIILLIYTLGCCTAAAEHKADVLMQSHLMTVADN